jgi:hypothetical protein
MSKGNRNENRTRRFRSNRRFRRKPIYRRAIDRTKAPADDDDAAGAVVGAEGASRENPTTIVR